MEVKQTASGSYLIREDVRYRNCNLIVTTCIYTKLTVEKYVRKKKLVYLGIPDFIEWGSHTFDGEEYRFLVLQRLGDDIEKYFTTAGTFCEKTVCYLALRLVSQFPGCSVIMSVSDTVFCSWKSYNTSINWILSMQTSKRQIL